jgi:hypothetical protein
MHSASMANGLLPGSRARNGPPQSWAIYLNSNRIREACGFGFRSPELYSRLSGVDRWPLLQRFTREGGHLADF